ncbi:dna-invertase from lambdoid prophage e14 [Escherichia coli]|uniref:Dna-invertase from lambdoid prophage e14 n=1 Tax=Escherichia coli TaxID=562 RepID=A0A377A3H2_ECOLX|nr:dna-invertase from lambdoid prophage e14 [Escherichia coli]
MALSPTDRGLKNCSGHYRQETLWLSGSWTGWGAVCGILVTLIEELRQRGVNFRSLTDSIDTSTPMAVSFFMSWVPWLKWSVN